METQNVSTQGAAGRISFLPIPLLCLNYLPSFKSQCQKIVFIGLSHKGSMGRHGDSEKRPYWFLLFCGILNRVWKDCGMRDTELYERLLGLKEPWKVKAVKWMLKDGA